MELIAESPKPNIYLLFDVSQIIGSIISLILRGLIDNLNDLGLHIRIDAWSREIREAQIEGHPLIVLMKCIITQNMSRWDADSKNQNCYESFWHVYDYILMKSFWSKLPKISNSILYDLNISINQNIVYRHRTRTWFVFHVGNTLIWEKKTNKRFLIHRGDFGWRDTDQLV